MICPVGYYFKYNLQVDFLWCCSKHSQYCRTPGAGWFSFWPSLVHELHSTSFVWHSGILFCDGKGIQNSNCSQVSHPAHWALLSQGRCCLQFCHLQHLIQWEEPLLLWQLFQTPEDEESEAIKIATSSDSLCTPMGNFLVQDTHCATACHRVTCLLQWPSRCSSHPSRSYLLLAKYKID